MMIRSLINLKVLTGFFLFFLIFSGVSGASVEVFTSSPPSSCRVTIYRGGVSLVQEEYRVGMREGINTFQFDFSQTKIDPSSVHLEVLKHPQKVKVKEVILSSSSKIIWKIHSPEPLRELIRISYFTQGFSWDVSYSLCLAQEKNKLSTLTGWIEVENKTGRDYLGANIRVAAGEPHLVEEKRKEVLLKAATRGPAEAEAGKVSAPQVQKEAVSEYHVYEIEDKIDLRDDERSQFLLFSSTRLPVDMVYVFNAARWGEFPRVRFKFKNNQNFPLPAGSVKGWVTEGKRRVDYLGEGKISYTPDGQQVEVLIGGERKIRLEKKMITSLRNDLEFSTRGNLVQYFEKEEYLLSIESFLEKEAKVRVIEEISGEWELVYSSIPVDKKERHALEFTFSIEGDQTEQFTYGIQRVNRVR